jgi:hypothetical protein
MSAISGKDRIVEWLYANPAGATRPQLVVWLGRSYGAVDHLVADAVKAGVIVRRHHGGSKAVTLYHAKHAPAEEPKVEKPVMTRIAGKAPSAKPDPNSQGEITDRTVITVCRGFEDRRFQVTEFKPHFSRMRIGKYPANDSAIARAYGGK